MLAGAREARALDTGRRVHDYVLRTWGPREGLPQLNVRALAQTPDGYLWIGTDAGVARFDGVTFTTFNAENAEAVAGYSVYALVVDAVGDLWVGTRFGAALARFRHERFERAADHFKLPFDTVISAFRDRQGALWFGDWRAVSRLRGGKFDRFAFKRVPPTQSVEAFAEDAQGRLWIGGTQGVARVQGDTFIPLTKSDGFEVHARVKALAFDRSGALWVGTTGEGLYRYRDRHLTRLGPADGLAGVNVTSLREDRDGGLWVGTERGLGRVLDGRAEMLTDKDGLPHEFVNALLEDREGNVWVGTFGGGLARLSASRVALVGRAQGLASDRVSAMYEASGGTLWVGTRDGRLIELDREAGTVSDGYIAKSERNVDSGLPVEHVEQIWQTPDGTIWLAGRRGADDGLFRLRGTRGATEPRRFDVGTVRMMGHLADGSFIYGGAQVHRFDVTDDVFVTLGPHRSAATAVFAVAEERDGTLWVGTRRGLYRRSDQTGSRTGKQPGSLAALAPGWRHYGPRDGFREVPVMSLHVDGGGLWLGTVAGLARLEGERFSTWPARADGPFGEAILAIAEDRREHLWLCTPRALYRMPKPRAGAPVETGPVIFGPSEGLEAPLCQRGPTPGRLVGARDGRILVATARGVAIVDPDRLGSAPQPPAVIVENVQVDGHPSARPAAVTAAPGPGNVEVAYTAPSLTAPERLGFRYRLEPYDRAWVEVGPRRRAFYTQVPPGDYQFHVQASVGDGRWGPVTRIPLALRPHLHETAVFRIGALAAAALLLGALAFAVHRSRLRRLEIGHAARLDERLRIARDLHDTLAQGFTGIVVMLEAAAKRLTDAPAPAREALESARELARTGLGETRRAVWDLRFAALEDASLVAGLEDLARRLGVGVPIDVRVRGDERALPAAQKAALLGIAQEAVTNALRHAGASRITIEARFGPRDVGVAVIDDGKGLGGARASASAAEPGLGARGSDGHFGLVGMRERAEKAGGALRIESHAGAGTEIVATLPLAALEGASP